MSDNHEVGLLADGAGTTVTATDVLIARTQPSPDGTLGRGIQVQLGASLTLSHANVVDNHFAAVLFYKAGGSVTDSLLAGTEPNPADTFGYADGLLVIADSVVNATGVVTRDNARAGILFAESEGEIQSCLSTGNGYGLVIQGSKAPEISDDSIFEDNETDTDYAGNLPVPDKAMPIPDSSEFD